MHMNFYKPDRNESIRMKQNMTKKKMATYDALKADFKINKVFKW